MANQRNQPYRNQTTNRTIKSNQLIPIQMNTQPEFKLEQTDLITVLTEGYPYQSNRGLSRLATEYVSQLLFATSNTKPNKQTKQEGNQS